jgi:hypothetical protein
MGMSGQSDNAAAEREEIIARIAHFKATQQRFQREREEYFVTTLETARHVEHHPRPTLDQPPFWS